MYHTRGKTVSACPTRRRRRRAAGATLAAFVVALLLLAPGLAQGLDGGAGPSPGDGGAAAEPDVAAAVDPHAHHAHHAAGASTHVSQLPPPVPGENPCPADARLRTFDVVAIDVDVPLNRFGDHVPEGMMYALREDIPRIRAAEAARAPATGLADDPIQPLVLRANLGDCVEFTFTNLLRSGERASLHVHGVSHGTSGAGAPVGFNPDSTVGRDESVTFRVYVDDLAAGEGARYFHSHGEPRRQVQFGLFGALIAEPVGSTWLNPRTGEEQRSGWDAIITDTPRDFREYVILYHEWGDENYQPRDKDNGTLPLVDPFEDVYRPGGRAINYRSEPFYTRAKWIESNLGLEPNFADLASSYTHGDPAQPLAAAYLGDPMKWRVVHGGGEVPHVHHLHGGGNRWPFQPDTQEDNFGIGLQKQVQVNPANRSILVDSQTVLPGEGYNAENECGAGGCQQSPGDFFFHCHINEHYPAGMWGIHRVHNTLQPHLVQLPDREGGVQPAVTSLGLLGTRLPNGTLLTAQTIGPWVELFLPPQGQPFGPYDSSVMDWAVASTQQGPLYLNEPETPVAHPNYDSPIPGERPPILFDPVTKRPSYPLLRPHIGERPPFAPGLHGPTAYLHNRDDANFELDRLCPEGRPVRSVDVRVAQMDLEVTRDGDTLNDGIMFVLANEEAEMRSGLREKEPLVVRSNVGDCVQVRMTNGLPELAYGENSVNLHPHFGQFDIQASDGAVVGFNFEQAIRPFEAAGTRLRDAVLPGHMAIAVEDGGLFHEGAYVLVGADGPRFDAHRIARIEGDVLRLETPLRYAHPRGAVATDEFVTYMIYFDTNVGLVYFHDHVSINHLMRGQFGAYVTEPPDSTYRDPKTGFTVAPTEGFCDHAATRDCTLTGVRADILTEGILAAIYPNESFRETVVMFGDNVPLRHGQRGVTWTNYRAEPLDDRGGDPAYQFSSVVHGDPYTGVTEAYVGDLFVMRVLAGALNHMHSFVMPDHRFPVERFDADSLLAESYTVGQSERFDLVARAGGEAQLPGDFLWYNGLNRHLEEGNWGLLRAHETRVNHVLPLPGREPSGGLGWPASAGHSGDEPRPPPDPGDPCPPGAPVERFNVSLIETDLVFNLKRNIKESNQKVFVLDEALPQLATLEGRSLEPLVLHVREGACMEVRFTNRGGDGRASFHSSVLAKDVRKSSGIVAGYNHDQTVAPGESTLYRYHVVPGTRLSIVAEFGDPLETWDEGAWGAINVVPAGAQVLHAQTGLPVRHGTNVIVVDAEGEGRRVFTLIYQDEDPRIGMDEMPYPEEVDGIAAINYRMEPLVEREEETDGGPDDAASGWAFSSFLHGDPETPVLRAYAGDPVQFNLVQVRGEQAHAFSLQGHAWGFNANDGNQSIMNVRAIMPVESFIAEPIGGAGGPRKLAGDYLYGNHRLPFLEAGMWGIFRVFEEDAQLPDLPRIREPAPSTPPGGGGGGGGGGSSPPGDPPKAPPGKGPGEVPARPGIPVFFDITLENRLDVTQVDLRVRADVPNGWTVRVTPTPIPPLAPGERIDLRVELLIPRDARGADSLRFFVVFDDGTVEEMGVAPVVRVLPETAAPTPRAPTAATPTGGGGDVREMPAPVALLLAAAALAAVVTRRRASPPPPPPVR